MTGAIWRTLDGFAQQAKAQGHNYVILVLSQRKAGRRLGGERIQVMPGLAGRFVGENDKGAPLVDVALVDLARWLERHRAWAPPPCSGEPHDSAIEPHDCPGTGTEGG